MDKQEMVKLIQADLGGDVLSLGIKPETIELKIDEALRKVGAYCPRVLVQSFPVVGEKIQMPEGTIAVQDVMTFKDPVEFTRGRDNTGDIDIFHVGNYMLASYPQFDPTTYFMRMNELETMMNFIEKTDWFYEKETRTLYLNYYNRPTATVKFLKKYTDVSEIIEDDVLDLVKNYALALCKIIEGTIRRKLQNAPGAMLLDGDALVSEGNEEKMRLEEEIKKQFSNIRFGFRA